ncbi:hypothetical protein RUM43_000967 [Polyplax serrata]|uniref:Uncharacterized protein n=1 Tax=Polyplax serrata TaxID=468196 RepID=A0AAN8SE78_POLSC
MNAEISYHPNLIAGKDNNNSPLTTKKWNPTNTGLVSVDESIESIVTEQNIENIERNLGGRERTSRTNSLTGIKEDQDGEEPEPDPTTYRLNRSRHNSIVGIVNSFRKDKRNSDVSIEEKRGRRKSWQARLAHLPKEKFGKGDRKRKQGSEDATACDNGGGFDGSFKVPPIYDRSKRKSWWNIFVPDEFTSK